MNVYRRSVSDILRGAGESFRTFPAVIACAFAFAVVTMVRIHLDWPEQEAYNFLFNCLHWSFALGAIFSLASITAAHSRFNSTGAFAAANILGAVAAAVTFVSLYLFGAEDTGAKLVRAVRVSDLAEARVGAAMAVSFLIFIVLAGYPKRQSDFARSFFMTHKAFFIALIYGVVIMSGASGVAGAVQALLYRDMSEKVYMYIATIVGFLAFAIFVGYFPDFRQGSLGRGRETAQKQPRFIEILFEMIMVPIMIAMTVVLLAWSGRTILTATWPVFSRLASIATGYAFAGIWLHVMVTKGETGPAKIYRRFYPVTALVILAFEAWAIVVQLGVSGLKTTEYYFIITWIVAVAASLLLLLMKEKSHEIIVAIICVMTVVAVMPVVGYHALPVSAQVSRLENILMEEGMFEDGRIVPAEEEPDRAVREAITDAVDYLDRAEDAALPEWFEERLAEKQGFTETFGFERVWPERDDYYDGYSDSSMRTSVQLSAEPVNISGYEWAFGDFMKIGSKEPISLEGSRGTYRIYWENDPSEEVPSLTIALNDETILERDMNDFIDRVTEDYPPNNRFESVEVPVEYMSWVMETPEVKVLFVFEQVEITVYVEDDRINYWFYPEALYFLEKE